MATPPPFARPYPGHLQETVKLPTGQIVTLRPIRPDDEPQHADFIHDLTSEDSRWRFFATIKDMSHEELEHLTNIDYDREMAFLATRDKVGGGYQTLGVVRANLSDDRTEAEFAIVVRSGDKHQGLGRVLMDKMLGYLSSRGIRRIYGDVLPENAEMLHFMQTLGFHSRFDAQEGVMHIWKELPGE